MKNVEPNIATPLTRRRFIGASAGTGALLTLARFAPTYAGVESLFLSAASRPDPQRAVVRG
jgi:hypothetical protein